MVKVNCASTARQPRKRTNVPIADGQPDVGGKVVAIKVDGFVDLLRTQLAELSANSQGNRALAPAP